MVLIEKEVTRIDKNAEKITKIYLTYYNLLIVQDLWPSHYQILSKIFMKEFIELRVCKYFELKILGEYHDLYVENDAQYC